jgi:hypothetical protein
MQVTSEAMDEQKISVFKPKPAGQLLIDEREGHLGKLAWQTNLFDVDEHTSDSDVRPEAGIDKITRGEVESNVPYHRVKVATMTLNVPAAWSLYTNLPIGPTVDLYLGFEHTPGPYWTAYWVDPKNPAVFNRLHVRRLVYMKSATEPLTDGTAFPPTIRWDWDENSSWKLVVGIPCDRAWCLLGADDPYQGDETDPDDTGTSKPTVWRVRGWFDRKPAVNKVVGGSFFDYIYPEPDLNRRNDDAFERRYWLFGWHKRPTVIATVVTADNRQHEIKMYHSPGSSDTKWDGEIVGGADTLTVTRTLKPDAQLMPGAARWGTKSAAAVVRAQSRGGHDAGEFGDAWMRCANGCCTADF